MGEMPGLPGKRKVWIITIAKPIPIHTKTIMQTQIPQHPAADPRHPSETILIGVQASEEVTVSLRCSEMILIRVSLLVRPSAPASSSLFRTERASSLSRFLERAPSVS